MRKVQENDKSKKQQIGVELNLKKVQEIIAVVHTNEKINKER